MAGGYPTRAPAENPPGRSATLRRADQGAFGAARAQPRGGGAKEGIALLPLKAAVVGAGTMGRHHARILSTFADVQLVAIVDADVESAERAAAASGAEVLADVSELGDVDIVVVATPTSTHAAVAGPLIERGVHLLVEKPLAPTERDAAEIARKARDAGVRLAVGHVERFNAAFGLLGSLTREPLMLSFERMSPYTPRITDSVVLDLMIHDLDLALWILGGYPIRVEAVGAKVFSDSLDIAGALLEFEGGRLASFQASRATQDKVRRISVSERDRFIVADSVRQDVLIKRETVVDFSQDEGPQAYRQANVVEVPYLDRSGEPLARELRDFIDAVREGRDPLVTGEAAAIAIRLASEIEIACVAS